MDILEKSLKTLEFDKILENIANYAKTEQSKRLCLELEPFDDIILIKKALQYFGRK